MKNGLLPACLEVRQGLIETLCDIVSESFLISDELKQVSLAVVEIFFQGRLAFFNAIHSDIIKMTILHCQSTATSISSDFGLY